MKSKKHSSEVVSGSRVRGSSETKKKQEAPASQTSNSDLLPPARYALRKGLGCWELTFDWQHEILRHEQGLALVAYLLLNPPEEPIHALDLAVRVAPVTSKGACISEIVDPETGQMVYLEKHARIQERSLALDEALTMRAVIRQQNDLEALLERKDTFAPVREEAESELKALYNYETERSERARDSAQRAVRAVRMALKRFHKRLRDARDGEGRPVPVLRAFAEHLQRFLLIPSAMCSLAMGLRTHSGFPGCFTYEPPHGVRWTSEKQDRA
jgi:hypothetical protein